MASFFHIGDKTARKSIAERGLNNIFSKSELWSNSDDWDDGVYLWDNLEAALEYQNSFFSFSSDVYQVEIDPNELQPDKTRGDCERVEFAWHSAKTIPPEQIRLLNI